MPGEIIYEYGKNPVNYGHLKNPTISYTEKNEVCAEFMHVDIILDKDEKITEIAFEGDGRMVGIAAMSLLTESLEGANIRTVFETDSHDILEMLEVDSLTSKRLNSALLSVLTIRNAFLTWKGEKKIDFDELN